MHTLKRSPFSSLFLRSFSSSRSTRAIGGEHRCTRTTKDGSLIPTRPEKYFADYTTLSRAEIVRLWRNEQISITPPSPYENQGSFMSDILVYGDDNVEVNGHPLFPSLLPFHPQYGHVPRAVSEFGGEEGEGGKHLLEWKREGPVVPTMVMAVNKPTGMVVSRPSSAGERSREEMNILRDIVAKHTQYTSDLRLPPGLLHSLLLHKLASPPLPFSTSPTPPPSPLPSMSLPVPLLPPPSYFFERGEEEEELEREGKKGGLKDWVVGASLAGFFPIGRLDKDTSGLLLFTNDGDFATAMTEIGNISRYYNCSLRYHDNDTDKQKGWTYDKDDKRIVDLLENGIELQDGLAKPHNISIKKSKGVTQKKEFNKTNKNKKNSKVWKVEVEVREGRNRLVRRLVSASKLGHLTALHRYKIGGVSLPSLGIKPGQWTVLPQEKVENLWQEVGGRERVVERKIEALQQQAQRMREIGRPSERLEDWLKKHQ